MHFYAPSMTRKWIITLLLLPTIHIGAQSIRLTRYDAPNALYFDMDRFFNFNLYERARFEMGLIWVSPNQYAANQRKVFGQWMLLPYVAYGTGDKAFKYGLTTQLRLPGPHDVRLRLWLCNDLERAASRRLNGYTMLSPSLNNSIVTSRFSGVKGGDFAIIFSPNRGTDVRVGLRQTWEDYRFNSVGFFYPNQEDGHKSDTRVFTEFNTYVDLPKDIKFSLRVGRMYNEETHYYLQTLAQYNADLGNTGLHLFAQAGLATKDSPYSRMFDLSGTAFSTYFFKNSFLTVRPNTFTTNIFAHICLNYTTPLPLWNLSWSSPHPFLQFNAMWGHLFGQDHQGHVTWDGLPLLSPYLGLLEPATGFDRLVHWGLMDIGFGAAYQICPFNASYTPEKPEDHLAFIVVADFILDNK